MPAVIQSITESARREVAELLRPFFPGWRGEAPEPAVTSAPSNRPAPAAARVLEAA